MIGRRTTRVHRWSKLWEAQRAETARVFASLWSGRLENDVELAAVFKNFPRTFEAARHHETVPRREFPTLASNIGDPHASFGHTAEFVLNVVHAPLTSRAGPNTGEALVARVAVVIPERQLWLARQQIFRGRRR